MSLKRKEFLKSILLALLLAACLGILWSFFVWHRLQKAPASYPSDKLASSEGLKISQTNGDRKVYQASIESFSIEKAKVGPFAIGPLNVAHLKNVIIDLFAEGLVPEANADRDSSKLESLRIDTLDGLLTDIKSNLLFRSKKIRIVDLKGISLNLWEGEKRVFSISSDGATMDRQTGDMIFVGHATLDAAENGSIVSHRIRWVRKTSLFLIKDPYILVKGNGKREGRELETDYLLKKIKYQINS